MVFLCLFSLVVLANAVWGQTPISCPGVALIRVGCFKSVNPKVSTPSLLFSIKVNYRQWDSHVKNIVCQCVAKRSKSNVIAIRNIHECRTGNLYAKEGSAPLGQCNTWGAKPCVKGVDCIGNTNTAFVYRVQPNTTPKPTTKPTTKATPKPTTPNKSAPENLQCYSYSIKMKLAKAAPGQKGSPAYSKMQCNICKTIRTIYRCYPCYQSVHFINVTTSNKETFAHIVLKFGCKQAHLKPLISKLQKGAIVSATCQDGKCPQTPILAQTVPGCTMMTACPVLPACSVPACGAPIPAPPPPPSPVVYTSTCPVGCHASCAPTCTTTCCQATTAAAAKAPKKAPAKKAAPKPAKKAPKAKPLVYNDGTPLYDYSLVD